MRIPYRDDEHGIVVQFSDRQPGDVYGERDEDQLRTVLRKHRVAGAGRNALHRRRLHLDVRADTMAYLEDVFGGAVETLYSNEFNIAESLKRADLVIGAVLVAGARAPKLVTEQLIAQMQPGSVVVDVAVDQGGCIETCRPTTHDHPTYEVHGVVHYCVANMPGAVSHTSTWALTNTTIPYAVKIAEQGLAAAAKEGRLPGCSDRPRPLELMSALGELEAIGALSRTEEGRYVRRDPARDHWP